MSTNAIDEALKQVSDNKKNRGNQNPQPQQTSEKTSIVEERTSFSAMGFQDGLLMAQDYQQGFAHGLSIGIVEARKRTLATLNHSLKANREKQVKFDDAIPFELYSLPGLSLFQLPAGEE